MTNDKTTRGSSSTGEPGDGTSEVAGSTPACPAFTAKRIEALKAYCPDLWGAYEALLTNRDAWIELACARDDLLVAYRTGSSARATKAIDAIRKASVRTVGLDGKDE